MKIPVIALFLLLCSPTFLPAQKIDISGLSDTLPANTSFFIGENHALHNLWAVKYSIVRHLYLHHDIHDIVIEYSKSVEYASNIYLTTGDSSLLSVNQLYGVDYFNSFVKPIKRLIESNGNHTAITIHCMDFERISFVNTIAYILDKYNKQSVSSTNISKYLNTISAERIAAIRGYPVYSRKYREAISEIHGTAKQFFVLDSSLLRQEISEYDYMAVKEILNNVAGITPKKNRANKNRDNDLYTSLIQCHDKFACFAGGFHISHANKNSLVNQYLSSHNTPVVVINMVCADSKKLLFNHTLASAMKNERNKRYILDSCMSTSASIKLTPVSDLTGFPEDYYRHALSYFMFFPEAMLDKY